MLIIHYQTCNKLIYLEPVDVQSSYMHYQNAMESIAYYCSLACWIIGFISVISLPYSLETCDGHEDIFNEYNKHYMVVTSRLHKGLCEEENFYVIMIDRITECV